MLKNAKKIGVEAGKNWKPEKMESSFVKAINTGIEEALKEIDQQVKVTSDGNKLFNTREVIGEDYLNRTVGVVVGQLGNYPSQALYPGFQKDSNGNLLDGALEVEKTRSAGHSMRILLQLEHIHRQRTFARYLQQIISSNSKWNYLNQEHSAGI